MIRVSVFFTELQPDNLFDIHAHIAISQYQQRRSLWFEQIPRVGELVYFQHSQGQSAVTFKVTGVHHYPSEDLNPSQSQPTPKSLITLSPFVPQTTYIKSG